MTHVFDEATAVERIDGTDQYIVRATTHPAYNNMVGPFGGITSATVLAAIAKHPEVLAEPLAFTINFLAPIAEGEWEVTLVPVRTNRTNQHWTFAIEQQGQIVATGTSVFGVRRETWGDTEYAVPVVPAAEEVEPSEFPEFIAWAGNYDKRFIVGGLDGVGSEDSTSTLWLRDRPDRQLDYPALLSMTDAFYPRVFLRRGTYMPAGTISLTTYFHATSAELAAQGARPLLATASSARFGGGHFDQYGQMWSDDQVLLATTHQLVYFKDAVS